MKSSYPENPGETGAIHPSVPDSICMSCVCPYNSCPNVVLSVTPNYLSGTSRVVVQQGMTVSPSVTSRPDG